MVPVIDKLKICYTLSESSRLHDLRENPIEAYEAAGHFGCKSRELVKNYALALGFEYLSADSKKSAIEAGKRFFTNKMTDKPMLLEVFTNCVDENEAINIIRSTRVDKKIQGTKNIKNQAKNALNKMGLEEKAKKLYNQIKK